jgi:NAD+ synthase (glutamine-hydrolysing)
MRVFRIAMAQMNSIVGDLTGNVQRIERWLREARRARADLVAFPELALTGYPPEDLLLNPRFQDETRKALGAVIRRCHSIAAVIGFVAAGKTSAPAINQPMIVPAGRQELSNAAAVIADGRLVTTYHKLYLPNYGVFDESRYFHPGRSKPVVVLNGTALGVNICEDIWIPEGPTRAQADAGAELIVNINASPFHVDKSRLREQMLATRARDNRVIIAYTNLVGGQDELIFDGNSVVLDQDGHIIVRGKPFEEDLLIADLNIDAVARARSGHSRKARQNRRAAETIERTVISESYRPRARARVLPRNEHPLDSLESVYRALVLGVRDYVRKNGFQCVVIGLSGGIDSALTAVIAADALGAANVLGVFMPSLYTSRDSREDVAELGRRLGIRVHTIPITTVFKSYLRSLASAFEKTSPDSTEENLQARIRGNLLMALSNKFGHLVLTTGNKSEMSVGYATLYGDMAGGFAVIKDVPKMMVYDLSRWRNAKEKAAIIPKRTIDRLPTAELKPNQTDQDILPPYPILDPILKAYVEDNLAPEEIVEMGFNRDTVSRVITMVDRSEYKRRQAPIGIKITHRAFGKDRRMPITNGYHNL